MATGKDAIVFNPAKSKFANYGLSASNYTGTAISYVVRGEPINRFIGEPGIGTVKYLDWTPTYKPSGFLPHEQIEYIARVLYDKHMIKTVIQCLRQKEE